MYSPDRLQLLSDEEIDPIYALPIFNDEERALYFDLNKTEKALSKKYEKGRFNEKIYCTGATSGDGETYQLTLRSC